jgi:23S rRNA (cytosine1962-C5)-methyltransferase
MIKVYLKPDLKLSFHPWILASQIERIEGDFFKGVSCEVFYKNHFLGVGYYNPQTYIAVRLVSRERVDWTKESFLERRLKMAAERRKYLIPAHTNMFRLVNSEGDGLPGLIVDKYDKILVIQCLTAGMDRIREKIVKVLQKIFQPISIYERSDTRTRITEGLSLRKGIIAGKSLPEVIIGEEYGLKFAIDIQEGHKTGFYLDQRENRALLGKVAKGKAWLNCFAYSGAFGIYALAGGAKMVVNVETSLKGKELWQENLRLNQLPAKDTQFICEDVFSFLKHSRQRFDGLILDPPAFARRKKEIAGAKTGYLELHAKAAKRAKRGAYLFTFSCSQAISRELFIQLIQTGFYKASRKAVILQHFYQAPDHPVNLFHPEGEYLKGLFLQLL